MESAEPSSKKRRTEGLSEIVANPDYKLPLILKEHFVYVGTLGTRSSLRNILKCMRCSNEIKGKGLDTFPARRHLMAAHEISPEKAKPVATLLDHFQLPKKQSTKTPTTRLIRQAVLDLVAVDGLPLNVMEGVGFQNFVAQLNPTVRCYSSRTVGRHLKEDFNKIVLPSLTKHIQDLPPNSIHVTLDLWSSKAQNSIMGLNVSYISEAWKLHQRCLAFEDFPESHTGRNIETRVRSILQKRKITTTQVGKIMADNASNMIAAFNLTSILNGDWSPVSTIEEDDLSSDDDECEDQEQTHEEGEFDMPEFSWERLGCCAHSLQLCVREAVKKDASAKHAIEQVNQVTLFFRRSNKMMHQLKTKTKSHRGLLLPGKTRWNSIFHAMKRILKADVFQAVLDIIRITPSTSTRVPPTFPESIKPQLEELVVILEPMNVATNRLQGNGITSSLVIPSLLEAYSEVAKMKCSFFAILKDVILII